MAKRSSSKPATQSVIPAIARANLPSPARFPTYAQVSEDLCILAANWKYLRLYDCSRHAEIVLEVIRKEGLDFQVMLGAEMRAEVSNPNCPWGADYDEATLASNQTANSEEIDRMIGLANRYAECVFSVSVGNEATVEWTDHLVPVDKLIDYVRRTKQAIAQPVTFCENYVPWSYKLEALAAELDFISLHTYPVWEYQTVDAALEYTQDNYYSVASTTRTNPSSLPKRAGPLHPMGGASSRGMRRRNSRRSTINS